MPSAVPFSFADMRRRSLLISVSCVVKTLLQRPNDDQCVTRTDIPTDIIAMAGGEAKGGLFALRASS